MGPWTWVVVTQADEVHRQMHAVGRGMGRVRDERHFRGPQGSVLASNSSAIGMRITNFTLYAAHLLEA